jgi:hypothetical protein
VGYNLKGKKTRNKKVKSGRIVKAGTDTKKVTAKKVTKTAAATKASSSSSSSSSVSQTIKGDRPESLVVKLKAPKVKKRAEVSRATVPKIKAQSHSPVKKVSAKKSASARARKSL